METYQYDRELLNEKGQRHGTLVSTSYLFDGLAYSHIYENGVLLQTTDFRYQIENQKELVGFFKDNVPYEGYFISENEFEIPEVSYYENGKCMAMYTTTLTTILETEMNSTPPVLVKTSFQNGMLWDGLHHLGYQLGDAHLLVTEYHTNGAKTHVDFWLLGMHYAELIKLNFIPNGYVIFKEKIEVEDSEEIDPEIDTRSKSLTVLFNENTKGKVTYQVDEKIQLAYEFCEENLSNKMLIIPGIVSYNVSSSNVLQYTQKYNFESTISSEDNSYNHNLILSFYMNLLYSKIPKLSTTAKNDYSQLFQEHHDFESGLLLFINEEKKPVEGLYFEKNNQTYSYSKYKKGEKTEKKEGLSIENIKQLFFQNK
ncbi:hypothetical protein [Flavobacterium sp. J27]|uniref:hypothetical protein n=1 Tax=Flavobacterium sp. J27 TaxID=2060419 RepID=UPI0010309A44|nr:hypothetical protein [Flavobacterium sp. J27]